MPSYERILYDVENGVGTIRLNQPEKRNPLSTPTSREVIDCIDHLVERDDVQCLVITGEGDAFSAGGDIGEFEQALDKPSYDHLQEGDVHKELFQKAALINKPLLASVNGYALGGGCGLVASTDMAIASEEAKLGTTEINIGIFPLLILPLMVRTVGYKNAMDMALTGRIMDAEEAKEMGLVSRVVPHDSLEEETRSLAEKIASRSPVAMNIGKRAFYGTMDMELDKALDFTSALRVTIWNTEDLREGAQAFLEKREPEWKGR